MKFCKGCGVVRGGIEVRFHDSSTKVPRDTKQNNQWLSEHFHCIHLLTAAGTGFEKGLTKQGFHKISTEQS